MLDPTMGDVDDVDDDEVWLPRDLTKELLEAADPQAAFTSMTFTRVDLATLEQNGLLRALVSTSPLTTNPQVVENGRTLRARLAHLSASSMFPRLLGFAYPTRFAVAASNSSPHLLLVHESLPSLDPLRVCIPRILAHSHPVLVIHSILHQIVLALHTLTTAGFVHGELTLDSIHLLALHPTDPSGARVLVRMAPATGLPRVFFPCRGSSARLLDVSRPLPVSTTATECFQESTTATECFQETSSNPSGSVTHLTPKADIWSFGILAWQLLSALDQADPRRPCNDVADSHGDGVRRDVLHGGQLPRPPAANDMLWSLITSCWEEHLPSRPTAAKLLLYLPLAAQLDEVRLREVAFPRTT